MKTPVSIAINTVPWASDWMSHLHEDTETKLCVGKSAAGYHAGFKSRSESGETEAWYSDVPRASLAEARADAYQRLEKQPAKSTPRNHEVTTTLNSIPRVVAVLSGEDTNVGKSTLARHMLRPGLTRIFGNCEYLLVEKLDRDIAEGEDKRYRPEDLKEIMMKAAFARVQKKTAIVIDCGGGQAQALVAAMKEAKGSEGRIDLFILPVVAAQKVDKIIETVEELLLIGVPADKLCIIVNRAPIGKTVADLVADGTFAPLATHAAEYGYRLIGRALPNNEAVEKLRGKVSLTVDTLADGTANFNAEFERLAVAGLDAEAAEVFELEYMSSIAKSMKAHMDACFAEVFGLTTDSGIEVVEIDG